MIKHFCDRCEKETMLVYTVKIESVLIYECRELELCKKCGVDFSKKVKALMWKEKGRKSEMKLRKDGKWYCKFCYKFLEEENVVSDGCSVYHDVGGCGNPVEKAPIPIQTVAGEAEPPTSIWRCVGMRKGEPHIWWAYTPLYGGEEYVLRRNK